VSNKKYPLMLSTSVEECIENYFFSIEEQITNYKEFFGLQESLDFLKMRRFLVTMFNNMREIDPYFITNEMRYIYKSIARMSKIFDTFQSKIKFPQLAFEKVFLRYQKDYMDLKRKSECLVDEIALYSTRVESLFTQKEHKSAVLQTTTKKDARYGEIHNDVRKLKAEYADSVHAMALLKDEQEIIKEEIHNFENLFKAHFIEVFTLKSKQYNRDVLSILNAQAYKFDTILWETAKSSKMIQKYFKEANIQGEFCSSTYLKYYLQTLNSEQMSHEQLELKQLYNYLKKNDAFYMLIIQKDLNDALNLKALLNTKCTLGYNVEIFNDEAKALRFSQQHKVSFVFMDEKLSRFHVKQYKDTYKNKIAHSAKFIVFSSKKALFFGADATIPSNYVAEELLEQIKEL